VTELIQKMASSLGQAMVLGVALAYSASIVPLCAEETQPNTSAPAPSSPNAVTMPNGGITPGPIDPSKTTNGKDSKTEKDKKGNIVRVTKFVPGTQIVKSVTVYNWYYANQNEGSVTTYTLQGQGDVKTTIKTFSEGGKERSSESWVTDPEGFVSGSNSKMYPNDSRNKDPNLDTVRVNNEKTSMSSPGTGETNATAASQFAQAGAGYFVQVYGGANIYQSYNGANAYTVEDGGRDNIFGPMNKYMGGTGGASFGYAWPQSRCPVTGWPTQYSLQFDASWLGSSTKTFYDGDTTRFTLNTIPLIISGVESFQTGTPWTPYWGIGFGMDIYQGSTTWQGPTSTEGLGSATAIAPALEEVIGVRYSLDNHWSVFSEWKFNEGFNPRLQLNNVNGEHFDYTQKYDTIIQGSLDAGVSYKF